MENKILQICNEYGFEFGSVTGYKGGYPIIEFQMSENENYRNIEKIGKKGLKKIIRKAEISAGTELGVGLNLINTVSIECNNDRLIVCGYITVVEKIIDELFRK